MKKGYIYQILEKESENPICTFYNNAKGFLLFQSDFIAENCEGSTTKFLNQYICKATPFCYED